MEIIVKRNKQKEAIRNMKQKENLKNKKTKHDSVNIVGHIRNELTVAQEFGAKNLLQKSRLQTNKLIK